jgi:peptidyl-prolyl cis-trans isomerase SurA
VTHLLPALIAAATLASAPAPARRVIDRVAATVNGEVVTLQDLVARSGEAYARADALAPGPVRDRARTEVLRRAFDAVVAEKLLEAAANELQLEVTDEQVDAAIAQIKQQNGWTEDRQLDAALADQGLDRAAFRDQLRREIRTIQLLGYKVRSKVRVSDQDVKAYYQAHPGEFAGQEEVLVRHIFLPIPDGATDAQLAQVRAQAEQVVRRLKAGEDFAKIARDVSKGPSAAEGGELGWIRRGTIEKSLEDVAFGLKKGEVSQFVRVGPGLHLLRVDDRRLGGGRPFDEVKEQIHERLANEQSETYREQYVAELRRDAAIDVRLPELQGEASASAK